MSQAPPAIDHYENFPVASILVPRALRPHIIAIYQFARHADDIADEGDAPPEHRLARLTVLQHDIDALFSREIVPTEPTVLGLTRAVQTFPLTPEPFKNLLSAFIQDVSTKRYESREQLLDYCRRSADPVGRLMLTLLGVKSPQARAWSDAICTGLQLTNFWQDVARDAKIGRIYIPLEALAVHHVKESDVLSGSQPKGWKALMNEQVNWAQLCLVSGVPLLKHIPGRMKWEIAFTIAGGLRILMKLRTVHYDMYLSRPKLSWRDGPALVWNALRLLWRARTYRS